MSFFSSSEMAHNVDSKDMLSGAIQNKDKMRDLQRRGKFQENGMNTVYSI